MPSLKIPASVLKPACKAASSVLPRNSPNEAWNCVCVHVDPSGDRYCYGTDGKVAAIAPLNGSVKTDEESPFTFMMSEPCLKTIALAGDDDDIAIRHKREHVRKKRYLDEECKQVVEEWYDQVTVKVPSATYKLDVKTLPFWTPDPIDFTDCAEFHPEHFATIISLMGGIYDDAELNFNYAGVHITSDHMHNTVIATATDGRRVGMGEFTAIHHGDGPAHVKSQPVMPRHLLKAVRGAVSSCESTVKVRFSERRCYIQVGDVTYYGALAEGMFPGTSRGFERYRTQGTRAGTIDRKEFIQALNLARICTNRELDVVGVRISSEPPNVTFESSAPDVGRAHVVHEDGIVKPFRVTIDAIYLIPVLKGLKDDQVSLTVIDDDGLLIETKTFSYILMGVDG